jgi:hypothetical protein
MAALFPIIHNLLYTNVLVRCATQNWFRSWFMYNRRNAYWSYWNLIMASIKYPSYIMIGCGTRFSSVSSLSWRSDYLSKWWWDNYLLSICWISKYNESSHFVEGRGAQLWPGYIVFALLWGRLEKTFAMKPQWKCNRSSMSLFGGPEFESRTQLHHCNRVVQKVKTVCA